VAERKAIAMTYEIDYSGWPLVRVRTEGSLSADGAQIALSAFEALLARRQPFAVAYDAGTAQSGVSVPAAPIVWNWIVERRADLDTYCMGWASYLPDERHRAAAEQRYTRVTGEVAGATTMPIRMFATWPETEAWAGQQVGR
jgi:hypothetical protein